MMDNIREKLVELLDKAENHYLEAARCAESDSERYAIIADAYGVFADYLIANGVTVQEWIPVTERLPCGYIVVDPSTNYKELEQYLVFCKDALFPTTAYFVDGKFVSLCETGCPSGERWCGIGEVTHWMPLSELPTPPKGE